MNVYYVRPAEYAREDETVEYADVDIEEDGLYGEEDEEVQRVTSDLRRGLSRALEARFVMFVFLSAKMLMGLSD